MKDFQYLKKKPKKFKNINKIRNAFKKGSKVSPHKPVFKLDIFLILIPLFIFAVFLTVWLLNLEVVRKIEKNKLLPLNYTVQLPPYPFMSKFEAPDISASAAAIMETDSQIILYAKNPNLRLSMASTTKIMTALVAMDYYKENSVLRIYTPYIEGSYLGIDKGEQFYLKDLLFVMLLPSSNEAAYAIAQNYPGGIDAFIQKMNEKAKALNLSNTHFRDPAGLDDENYSTPIDLSRLAYFASRNKTLAAIFATRQKIISDITGQRQLVLENRNKLLGIDGVNGIKTGTTEGAGEVLVVSRIENGHSFIIVIMKSKQRFADAKTLFSLISNNLRYITPQLPDSFTVTDLK